MLGAGPKAVEEYKGALAAARSYARSLKKGISPLGMRGASMRFVAQMERAFKAGNLAHLDEAVGDIDVVTRKDENHRIVG